MKNFIAVIIILNTLFFGAMAYFSMQTYRLTDKNTTGMKASIDSTNVRLKSINASLDDKLYGIMSTMPK